MTGPFVSALFIVGGLFLAVSIQHAIVCFKRRMDKSHLLFAILSLLGCCYVVIKVLGYQSHSADELVALRRWEISMAMVFFGVLPWFVADYSGVRPRLLLVAFSAFFAVVLAVNMALPFGVQYSRLPDFQYQILPWGERIADQRLKERNFWHLAMWAGVLSVFAYAIFSGVCQYRGKNRRQGMALVLAMGLFLACMLFNQIVNLGYVEFTHTGELGFLALVMVVSHGLIDELLRAEQQVATLQKQLWHTERVARTGALAASIAHEINQPLAAILSNAQAALRFLARGKTDLTEITQILRDIVRDDKRASATIAGLRTMLKGRDVERERMDLADCLRELLGLMHSELLGQQVELVAQLEPGCAVHANRAQIQQVALNLIVNALEAMSDRPPRSRRLDVSVARAGDGLVELAVRDTGPGIAAEQADKIFDAFYSAKERGLGLGLAICRSIVEAHGGSIRTESRAQRGATFIVHLPGADLA